MAKNRKDEVPGASRGRGLVIIFGILDVFCVAFLVISLIASPGGPVSASVPVETLPAFEENLDHYGAAADNSETYTSGNSVVYNSPTAPETTAAVPETTAPTVPAAERFHTVIRRISLSGQCYGSDYRSGDCGPGEFEGAVSACNQ